MKQTVLLLMLLGSLIFISASQHIGKPWNKKIQKIPGKIECEFYDLGGEGVAYHDIDSINNGSGKLNPANGSFLNEFRMKEGVDLSYTKSAGVDEHVYNKVNPKMEQLYVGWTQPGEWINYTIKVKETGLYRVGVMYTAHADGSIAISVDGKSVAKQLKIASTYNELDTIAWRQWHHWNKMDDLSEVKMTKGIRVLTLHIEEQGNMNFDYLEFVRKD